MIQLSVLNARPGLEPALVELRMKKFEIEFLFPSSESIANPSFLFSYVSMTRAGLELAPIESRIRFWFQHQPSVKTSMQSVACLRLHSEQKTQGKAKVKYKRTSLKALFVYNRYSAKVDLTEFIEFFHIETAKSLMVIDTTYKVQTFSTLSFDVSFSTRAAEGQGKDKSHVHHSHLCTRIVLTDGRRIRFKFGIRDVSGVDTFPLSFQHFKSYDRVLLQSATLLRCVVLCQRFISEATAVANGGGAAMPSMAGALTKINFPLVLK